MTDPVISFGQGRNQVTLKGEAAIREGGWAIRWLLLARGAALLLSALAVAAGTVAVIYWRFWL